MMKYKREATLFQTAKFPIRGLITNGLMKMGQQNFDSIRQNFDSNKIPISRSEAPSRDQLKKEKSFVESVGKFYADPY